NRIARTQYQYTLEDSNSEELRTWSQTLFGRMKTLPELKDVASDLGAGGLQASLTIDRDTASRLGIRPQAIDDTLYDAFGQRQVSTIFTQLNQYRVILEVKPEYQQSAEGLGHIFVRSDSGQPIPLSSFTTYGAANTPLS